MIVPILLIALSIALLITYIVTINILKTKINQAKQEQNSLKERYQSYAQQAAYLISKVKHKQQQEKYLIFSIQQKEREKDKVIQDLEQISNLYNTKNKECQELNTKIIEIQKQVDQTYEEQKKKINNRIEEFKRTAEQSASYYFDNLEKSYQTAEAGHAEKMTRLKEEMDGAAADLQKLQDTRKAAHQALLKQQEIKENKDNYRLLPSSFDIQDITALKRVKETLHKPRILSMLIWQTYYQILAKEKFPIILQDKTKMGIYKITNIRTDECYIGQSVDIYKRWTDHCKAGLGIDAPVGNKLYKAMQDEGLYNFTFQLLCECPKQELDEKEKYFINLYQADLYGYNGTKGNK